MVHIMLVEDNPGDVLLVREAIRQSPVPADVLIAYNGEDALRMLMEEQVKVSLIFLDLNLPKFNGLQILERYRFHEGPPVVVLTSSTNPDDRERALRLGAKAYLLKPLDLNEYMRVVRSALEKWMPRSQANATGEA